MSNLSIKSILFLIFVAVSFAQSGQGTTQLITALDNICRDIYSLLPPIAMLLVVAGAVVYAAGQFASAEMRARATGWATAMVIGALFAFVLVLLLPPIILALWASGSGNWMDYCSV